MKTLIRFYIPLALPQVLMGISHGVISSTLASLGNAAVILSAYTLAVSIAQLAEAPILPVRQFVMTLAHDRRSWKVIQLICWGIALVMVGLELASAWGPLMRPVLQGLFRVPDHLLAPTLTMFRLHLWLVALSTWRFLHQGMVVARRQPIYVTAGVCVRLPFMVLMGYGITHWGWVTPLLAGPSIMMTAIFVEALVAWVGSRRWIKELPEVEPDLPALTIGSGLRFFIPLAASSVALTVGRPFINATVGSSAFADTALAAMNLLYIVQFVLLGPLGVLNQATVIFGKDRKMTLRFCLYVGVIVLAVLLALGYTGPGNRFLAWALNAPAELTQPMIAAVKTMALAPLFFAMSDYLQGILLLEQNTRPIGYAKVVGVVVSIVLVRVLIGTADTPSGTAVVAVLATASGAVAEVLVMYGLRLLARQPAEQAG